MRSTEIALIVTSNRLGYVALLGPFFIFMFFIPEDEESSHGPIRQYYRYSHKEMSGVFSTINAHGSVHADTRKKTVKSADSGQSKTNKYKNRNLDRSAIRICGVG